MSSGQARLNTFARPAPVKYLLLLHTNRQEGNGTRAEQSSGWDVSPPPPCLPSSSAGAGRCLGLLDQGSLAPRKLTSARDSSKLGAVSLLQNYLLFFLPIPTGLSRRFICVFLPCVATTLRSGGQASDQCRIYRSLSCQSWPEVGRLLILCHAGPHSGDASQQSGCSIMSSLPSIPGLLGGNFLPWMPTLWLLHNPLAGFFYCNYKHQECLANI